MTLPAHIRTYMGLIESVCASMSNGAAIRPIVIAALLDQESQGGRSLKPHGPEGTGDFTLRCSSRYANNQHFRMLCRDDGTCGYMPNDLKGWGRGLWQIDYGAHAAWCLSMDSATGRPLWAIPGQNCRKACEVYLEGLHALDGDEDAAIAAYNCGWPRVKEEISHLTPVQGAHDRRMSKIIALDALTTHGIYLSSILNRIERWQAVNTPPPPKPQGVV